VSDITVRPVATDDEADEAGRIVATAYFSYGFEEESYRPTLLDGRDRARESLLLVATDPDGRLLGSVTYVEPGQRYAEVCGPDEGEFRMLGVDPSAQGRGVGRALVQACIDRAREDGRRALVMCTEVRMRAAQRLYEQIGFERIPERDWVPNDMITLLAYRLPLEASRDS
jgi:ribosomal protein S18 acetylase RimI-like enzyme